MAALFIFAAMLIQLVVAPALAQQRTERLIIDLASGAKIEFEIEVARTSQEKAMGLMFRQKLGEREGMLFPYGDAHDIAMWMRNTYIPLDMIFIRADGVIHRIEARTEPFSETMIRAGTPVTAVLEIGGGEAARLGIRPGDKVVHPHFSRGAD